MEPSAVDNRISTRKGSGINFYLILAIAFIAPLLFLPGIYVPFQFSKTFFAIVLTAVLVIVLALQVLRSGRLSFHWSLLLGSVALLPITYLISATFSSQPILSFWGYQLESGTFGFVLFCATLVFSIVASRLSQSRIFSVVIALLASAWVIFLFQLTQVLLGAPFPALFSNDPTANLIGSWNDFGIFSGLVFTLSLISIEMLKLSKKFFVLVLTTIIVSGFFVTLVNVREVWVLIAITAFATLVHAFTKRFFIQTEASDSPSSAGAKGILSIVILVFASFSIFFSGSSVFIQEQFNVGNFEVRPSVEGTLEVLSGVYRESPFFGSGPNTFSSQWLLYRPEGVLSSPYWNTSFLSGSGAIPTAIATGGIVVAFGWVFFLLMLLVTSARALMFSSAVEESTYFLVSITSLGSLYLGVLHILYPPSQLLTILFFLFAGLFIASLVGTRMVRYIDISFIRAPRIGFVAVFTSIVILIASAGALYATAVTYASSVYSARATALLNTGDLNGAFVATQQALQLRVQDQHYRALASIDLARLDSVFASDTGDRTENQEKFRELFTRSLENSNNAIALNDKSFQNWFLKAFIYSSVVPLEIEGAYDVAVSTLEKSREFNPKNPEIDFRLAQVHLVGGTESQSSEAIARALELKPNYTNAILLRAQTELDKGEIDNAINSVSVAVYFEPQNSSLLYQLGLLLLEKKAYSDASRAFERALAVEPNFANASFFLAHAYSFLNKTEEAVQLLQSLKEKNHDNETLSSYLEDLKGGNNPFEVGAVSPEEDSELE
ncbi:hypothetical protein COU15_01795 [Candidatus Kaiserbacteria bacterium CG10_big_fil_rev_8_21_14_0_10_45_20]|uniref:Tfp pilus assembly protein PilF n=1 Tax=Candidatus Kaiserbacteria bacterium CG10_big_fil_rev_8_21_14_0_10_45_20 TaxID=1974607 RepID=A0A2H0UFS3_9BACT|nr:MAG: hypothetical protein COU15_01795 [Candidatus Kaiserbacteria bacterium CG10_big_fil_rev_8_21_14_0_10_45_20]